MRVGSSVPESLHRIAEDASDDAPPQTIRRARFVPISAGTAELNTSNKISHARHHSTVSSVSAASGRSRKSQASTVATTTSSTRGQRAADRIRKRRQVLSGESSSSNVDPTTTFDHVNTMAGGDSSSDEVKQSPLTKTQSNSSNMSKSSTSSTRSILSGSTSVSSRSNTEEVHETEHHGRSVSWDISTSGGDKSSNDHSSGGSETDDLKMNTRVNKGIPPIPEVSETSTSEEKTDEAELDIDSVFFGTPVESIKWEDGMTEMKRMYVCIHWLLTKHRTFISSLQGNEDTTRTDASSILDMNDVQVAEAVSSFKESAGSRFSLVEADYDEAGENLRPKNDGSTDHKQALSYLVTYLKERARENYRNFQYNAARGTPTEKSPRLQKIREIRSRAMAGITPRRGGTLRISGSLDNVRLRAISEEYVANRYAEAEEESLSDVSSRRFSLEFQLPSVNDLTVPDRAMAYVSSGQTVSLREERAHMTRSDSTQLEKSLLGQFCQMNVSAFVTPEFYEKEVAECEKMSDSLHARRIVRVREEERVMYKKASKLLTRKVNTGGFLAYVSSRYTDENGAATVLRMMDQVLTCLRQMEDHPNTWHRGGFLHRVDNFLSVMMYRRHRLKLRKKVKAMMAFSKASGNKLRSAAPQVAHNTESKSKEKVSLEKDSPNPKFDVEMGSLRKQPSTESVATTESMNSSMASLHKTKLAEMVTGSSDKSLSVSPSDDITEPKGASPKKLNKGASQLWLDQLNESRNYRSSPVVGYIFALFFIAMAGLAYYVLWYQWHDASTNASQESISFLAAELQLRVGRNLKEQVAQAYSAVEFVQSSIARGDLELTSLSLEQGNADTLLASYINVASVGAMYVASVSGAFVGAFASAESTPARFVSLNASSSCASVFGINPGDGTRGTQVEADQVHSSFPRLFNMSRDSLTCTSGEYYPSESMWFTEIVSMERRGWTNVFAYPDQTLGVTLSEPVFHANGTLAGVVGVDIHLDQTAYILQNLQYADSGVAFIASESEAVAGRFHILASSVQPNQYDLPQDGLQSSTGASTVANKVVNHYILSANKYLFSSFGVDGVDAHSHSLITSSEEEILISASVIRFSDNHNEGTTAIDLPFSSLEWVVAIVFPTEDYVSTREYNDFLSTVLGALSVFFALVIAFYAYYIIPDREGQELSKTLSEHVNLSSANFRRKVKSPKACVSPRRQHRENRHLYRSNRTSNIDIPGGSTAAEDNSIDALKKHTRRSEVRAASIISSGKTGIPIPAHGQQMNRFQIMKIWRAPKGFHVIIFSTLLVFCAVGSVFFLWRLSMEDVVTDLSYTAVSETMARLETTTATAIEGPHVALTLMQSFLFSSLSSQASMESLFVTTLKTQRDLDGYSSVSRLYFGFADSGHFIGAEEGASIGYPVGDMHILAKDSSNSQCYSKYEASIDRSIPNSLAYTVSRGAELWRNSGCSYDPRSRAWYKDAVEARQFVWSDLYAFPNGETPGDHGVPATSPQLGVTLSLPVYDPNSGSLLGVLGADFNIAELSRILNNVKLSSTSERQIVKLRSPTIGFVMERESGILVANSAGPIVQTIGGFTAPVTASQSPTEEVSRAAKFLDGRPGGRTAASRGTLPRSLSDPIRIVIPSSSPASHGPKSLDWLVVVAVPPSLLFGLVENASRVSTLLCVCVVFCVIYMIGASSIKFNQKIFDFGDNHDKALSNFGGGEVEKDFLVALMFSIRGRILRAANNMIDCPVNKENPFKLVDFNELRQHYVKAAVGHVKDCRFGRNILTMTSLAEYESPIPLQMYKLYTNMVYRSFVVGVIVVHILLSFFEPATQAEMTKNGVEYWVLTVEIMCIAVQLLDLGLKMVIVYRWQSSNILTPSKDYMVAIFRFALLVLITLDWALTVKYSISFEYVVPLRPLLLLLKNHHVRQAAENFIHTLYAASDVFLLYFVILITATVMGILLFRSVLGNVEHGPTNPLFQSNVNEAHDSVGVIENSFINFIHAVTTTFIFMSTGENYTELVYPAFRASPWYVLYFVVFALVGLFFVLAMVIGTFEDSFKKMEDQQVKKRTLFSRVGAVSAFILLDLDMNQVITRREFEVFICRLAPYVQDNPVAMQQLYRLVGKHHGSKTLDIRDFVQAVEEITWRETRRNYFQPFQHSQWRIHLQHLFEGRWYRQGILFLVVFNTWVWCLYGTYKDEGILDWIQLGCMGVYIVELSLKLLTYSPSKFWYYAYYFSPIDPRESNAPTHHDPSKIYTRNLRRKRSQSMIARSPSEQSAFSEDIYDSLDSIPERERASYPNGLNAAHGGVSKEALGDELERELIMFTNRSELRIIVGSSMAVLLALFFAADWDLVRFAMTLPVLRIGLLVRSIRRLVFNLVQSIPVLLPVVVLLSLIFFIFGTVGVTLFSGKFSTLLQENAPDGDFDTLSRSLLTLFQLFTGEAWERVMYAGINVTSWAATGYFLSFIVIVTLLFGNLFRALFLDPHTVRSLNI